MDIKNIPQWFFDEKGRKSYFENTHGEAWVAVVRDDVFLFSGQDIDWEARRIEKPNYEELAKKLLTPTRALGLSFEGVIMNEGEMVWLLSLFLSRPDVTTRVYQKAG